MDRLRKVVGGLHRIPRWIAGADLVVLLAVLGVATSGLAFLVIADAATEGAPGHLDVWLLRSLREPENPADPLGPRWLEETARDVTALGGYPVLGVLVAGVLGHLLIGRHRSAAVLVFASTAGGWLLSTVLKGAFARPRPDLVPHLAHVSTASFPSGHAMLSAVVYLTLGAMLARLTPRWRAKLYFVAVAMLLSLAVGTSRVYLGVHYPTDVVAGWTVGLAWAASCWLVARYFQRRGVVEGNAG